MSESTPSYESDGLDLSAAARYAVEQCKQQELLRAAVHDPPYDFLGPAQEPDEIGRLGEYRVLRLLGQGGMGIVFKAQDSVLHRFVALKVMLPSQASEPSAKERFLREARAVAALDHPNIVRIHKAYESPVPFFAMELLEGESLHDHLERKKKLPLAEVIPISKQIALGLAAAHDQQLIHRDIKPGNLWLNGEGVKILDFGLVRDVAQPGLTLSGSELGTPGYMPPEQAAGEQIDYRADLFALGCVMYRMLSGRTPFLRFAYHVAPPNVAQLNPDVPRAWAQLIHKLIELEPNHRLHSAKEVANLLGPGLRPFTPGSETDPGGREAAKVACPSCKQILNVRRRERRT